MVHTHRTIPKFLLFFLPLWIIQCANQEVNELRSSVDDLQFQVRTVQTQTHRADQETTSTLQEVNQNLSITLDELRHSQAEMEKNFGLLSTRLAQMEQNVAVLQDQSNRMNTFASDAISQTQETKRSSQTLQDQITQIVDRLNTLINEVNQTRGHITNVQTEMGSRIAALESRGPANVSAKRRTAAAEPAAAGSASGGKVHVVQPGETLNRIAAKYGVTARQLQDLNGVENPSSIKVGQSLRLP